MGFVDHSALVAYAYFYAKYAKEILILQE